MELGSPWCHSGLALTSPTSALRKSGWDTIVSSSGSAAAAAGAVIGDDGERRRGTARATAPTSAAPRERLSMDLLVKSSTYRCHAMPGDLFPERFWSRRRCH